jgi:hypothetical protein
LRRFDGVAAETLRATSAKRATRIPIASSERTLENGMAGTPFRAERGARPAHVNVDVNVDGSIEMVAGFRVLTDAG